MQSKIRKKEPSIIVAVSPTAIPVIGGSRQKALENKNKTVSSNEGIRQRI
jgi:hypothetical protein